MKTKIIYLLFLSLFAFSCVEEAEIRVTNKLPNVKLDNIKFYECYVGSYILPGETRGTMIQEGYSIKFPIVSQLEFTMSNGNKRVYLKTKESFTLNKDDVLEIIIDEDMEVISPLNETLKMSLIE